MTGGLIGRIRKRLTYATVLSAITAFVVLCGGAALAANQLAKGSVGKKQLKANAVTTAKLRKEAVAAGKIQTDSIDGSKVKDGSVGAAGIEVASMPYSRVVHRARGTSTLALAKEPDVRAYPLDSPTYTQAAGEDDFFYATIDITFSAGCVGDREATAFVLLDSTNPDPKVSRESRVAVGTIEDQGSGAVTKPLILGTGEGVGAIFQHAAATNHTLTFFLEAECESGSGVTASNGAIDVVGIR